MSHIVNTLSLMSLQHELAMAAGKNLRFETMLQHFMKVCVRRLDLSSVYVYINKNEAGLPAAMHEICFSELSFFTSFPKKEVSLNDELDAFLKQSCNKMLEDNTPYYMFEEQDKKYVMFPLSSIGGIALERRTSQLSSQVILALQPLMKRLASSCLACIDYERSLIEIDKRREAEEAFRKTEVRLRSVLDNVVDGIITINNEGHILSFNAAAERMFGYALEEALNLNIIDLMPETENTNADVHINLFKCEGEERYRGFGREVTGQRKDGSFFPMDWAVSEVHVDGQRLFTGIARDITERREVEESLKEQLRYANAVSRLTEVLISEDSPRAILDKTVSIVGEALHADRALIVNIDCIKEDALPLSEWLNPYVSQDIESIQEHFNIAVFENTIASILAKDVEWVESHVDNVNQLIIADGVEELLHDKMHIKSLLYYPFWFSDKGFYVLAFDQVDYRRQWRSEDVNFIKVVTQHINVALKKVNLLLEREGHIQDLKLAATAFETREAILITDHNSVIQRVNKAFTRITGYTSEEVIGKTPKILKSGRQSKLFYQKMWAELYKVGHWQGEIWNKRKSGEIYPEWQTITAVRDDQGEISHFVATFQDITERKRSETRIKHLAYYDELTGLPNRSLLIDRLRHEVAVAKRRHLIGALLFIDLDRFKTINDSLGHPSGDVILQQVAKRLQSQVRGEDTVARLGGDEFVVLLPDVGKDPIEASHAVQTVAEKISQSIAEAFELNGHEYYVTPSVGVVLFPDDEDDVNDILKHADTAMYRAKASGRNTIRFYLPSMQEAADERLSMEKDLRHAIARNELFLYYQPLVNNRGGIEGAEALIRWQHPLRGMVAPDQFISLAEETGQIFAIGEWVLRTAVAQIGAWRERNQKSGMGFVSVNVSPRQFHQADFIQQVISILEASGVPPQCLKLEITEGIVMADVQDAIDKMSALKALGVRFAIDDFGTGYSSMAYLKRLPLDQLKIDKSFVQDISVDPNDAAIVETIIAMANHLGLDVVAEGVETEAELEFLDAQGCKVYQGYLFSRPVPVKDFSALLQRHSEGERFQPLSGLSSNQAR